MLQLRGVVKQFADQVVLRHVGWHVRPTDRVGLCGENGAGKTTLLRLLAGQAEVDAGTVQFARGTTIGYLPQEGLEHSGRSLFAEARSALAELLAAEVQLQELEIQISNGADQAVSGESYVAPDLRASRCCRLFMSVALPYVACP